TALPVASCTHTTTCAFSFSATSATKRVSWRPSTFPIDRATITFLAPCAPSFSNPCALPKVSAVTASPCWSAIFLAKVIASNAGFGMRSPWVSTNTITLIYPVFRDYQVSDPRSDHLRFGVQQFDQGPGLFCRDHAHRAFCRWQFEAHGGGNVIGGGGGHHVQGLGACRH